jgi:AmmeMemoRadiSam system protein A
MRKTNLRMSSLGNREKQLLLELARRALTVAAERSESLSTPPQDPELGESIGAFVTLRKRGRLRGCIGQVGSGRSLMEVVAHCAKSAALEDPRFEPVRAEELREIEIELSVLSPLEEIAPERIEVGKHGLMVSAGLRRGVLLPQVATECHWTAVRFLEETCLKAELERDAWRDPATKIQGFTAEVFAESDFRSEELPGPRDRAKPRYSIST